MKDDRFTEILREYGVTIRAQSRLAVPEGSGNGTVVRAACRSGIVTGLEEKDVGDMKPFLKVFSIPSYPKNNSWRFGISLPISRLYPLRQNHPNIY